MLNKAEEETRGMRKQLIENSTELDNKGERIRELEKELSSISQQMKNLQDTNRQLIEQNNKIKSELDIYVQITKLEVRNIARRVCISFFFF